MLAARWRLQLADGPGLRSVFPAGNLFASLPSVFFEIVEEEELLFAFDGVYRFRSRQRSHLSNVAFIPARAPSAIERGRKRADISVALPTSHAV
jgi:hypothetical protein